MRDSAVGQTVRAVGRVQPTTGLGSIPCFLVSILLLWGICTSGSVAAQEVRERGIVGLSGGRTSARQVWTGPVGSEGLEGISLGVFVDVETPIPFLGVRAGGGYVGRGSVVWDQVEDPDRASDAKIRSHYMSFPVHGLLELGIGPVAGYLLAGPTVDILISSECSAQFCQFIREERPTGVNVVVGLGAALDIPGDFRTYVELRLSEGLGDAYLADGATARNRTIEMLVRLGRPF